MAGPGNRHCANCIGTLSFPIRTVRDAKVDSEAWDDSDLAPGNRNLEMLKPGGKERGVAVDSERVVNLSIHLTVE